jgi:hypothetical protein
MAVPNYFDFGRSSVGSLAGSQDRVFEEMAIVFRCRWRVKLDAYLVCVVIWPVVWIIVSLRSTYRKLETMLHYRRNDSQWDVEKDEGVWFGQYRVRTVVCTAATPHAPKILRTIRGERTCNWVYKF